MPLKVNLVIVLCTAGGVGISQEALKVNLVIVLYTAGGVGISQEALKQRLKLKATRTASRGKQDSNYPLKEEGKSDHHITEEVS